MVSRSYDIVFIVQYIGSYSFKDKGTKEYYCIDNTLHKHTHMSFVTISFAENLKQTRKLKESIQFEMIKPIVLLKG